jgi:PQQ-dependent catabolism-associated CXXCW motif protein
VKRHAAAALLCLALAGASAPEPDGYRTEAYRAPTPATLKGATVLTSDEAEALWRDKRAAFIDVLPQAPRPKNLPADVVWRDKARADIPGSLWLPDTGYGELAPSMQAYFVAGLDKAQAGDRERALAFYCQRDCWMSWNAAKRALALGFRHVDWYPDGADGWREAGLPLEPRQPEPRP